MVDSVSNISNTSLTSPPVTENPAQGGYQLFSPGYLRASLESPYGAGQMTSNEGELTNSVGGSEGYAESVSGGELSQGGATDTAATTTGATNATTDGTTTTTDGAAAAGGALPPEGGAPPP